MDLEKRISDLENMVLSLVSSVSELRRFSEAYQFGIGSVCGDQGKDISDNRGGIEETYESSIANADDIADVRTAIEEVYEMIEGGN